MFTEPLTSSITQKKVAVRMTKIRHPMLVAQVVHSTPNAVVRYDVMAEFATCPIEEMLMKMDIARAVSSPLEYVQIPFKVRRLRKISTLKKSVMSKHLRKPTSESFVTKDAHYLCSQSQEYPGYNQSS